MKQYIIGSMLLSSILLASCSLDETPRSKFSEEEAFSTPKLVYVNTVANVYSSIGNGLYGSDGGSVHTFQEWLRSIKVSHHTAVIVPATGAPISLPMPNSLYTHGKP